MMPYGSTIRVALREARDLHLVDAQQVWVLRFAQDDTI